MTEGKTVLRPSLPPSLPPFPQPSFLSSLITLDFFWRCLPDTLTRFPITAFICHHFGCCSLLSSITFPRADPVPFLPLPSLACHYLIGAHLSSLSPPVSASLLHAAIFPAPSVHLCLGRHPPILPPPLPPLSVPLYPPDFSRAPSPPPTPVPRPFPRLLGAEGAGWRGDG